MLTSLLDMCLRVRRYLYYGYTLKDYPGIDSSGTYIVFSKKEGQTLQFFFNSFSGIVYCRSTIYKNNNWNEWSSWVSLWLTINICYYKVIPCC